jgi:hypothetical protein
MQYMQFAIISELCKMKNMFKTLCEITENMKAQNKLTIL